MAPLAVSWFGQLAAGSTPSIQGPGQLLVLAWDEHAAPVSRGPAGHVRGPGARSAESFSQPFDQLESPSEMVIVSRSKWYTFPLR